MNNINNYDNIEKRGFLTHSSQQENVNYYWEEDTPPSWKECTPLCMLQLLDIHDPVWN